MTEQPEETKGPDVSTVVSVERTRLAYDRTMLSWIRTATSLITFGFSIEQFFRIAKTGMPESDLFGPQEFGVLMISVGLVALLLATLENRSAIKALATKYPAKEGYPVTALVAVAIASIVTWLVMLLVARMADKESGSGFARDTITRFMGLIVLSMGIQFALTGLRQFGT